MKRLKEIVGSERSVEEVSRVLYYLVSDLRAPAVGAMHVTCADEAEEEGVAAFQRGFVQEKIKQNKVVTAMPGAANGKAMRKKACHFVHPSIIADSSSSWGISMKKPRIIQTANSRVTSRCSAMTATWVSSSLRFLITRKSGMMAATAGIMRVDKIQKGR